MKKSIYVLASLALILSACTTSGIEQSANTTTTTQQLGAAAIKVAVNAKCNTELNNQPAWRNITKVMTAEQKQAVQADICGCVSNKAPQNITTVDLATAAIDPAARTAIITNAVTKTINACVAEVLN